MKIIFKNIEVKTLKNGSAVFMGRNHQVGLQDQKSIRDGFGSLNGTGNVYQNGQHIYVKKRRKA